MWWLRLPFAKKYGVPVSLAILGAGLILYGFVGLVVNAHTESSPQEIPCARLAASGPGDNAYVVVTDYLLCDFDAVSQGEKYVSWWVPAVPTGTPFHTEVEEEREVHGNTESLQAPPDFRVIVQFLEGMEEVRTAAARGRLEGIVANDIWSLSRQQRELLQSHYPDVDLDRLWVIEASRTPHGFGTLLLIFGAGIAFLLGGGACVRSEWRLSRGRSLPPRATVAPAQFTRSQRPRPMATPPRRG